MLLLLLPWPENAHQSRPFHTASAAVDFSFCVRSGPRGPIPGFPGCGLPCGLIRLITFGVAAIASAVTSIAMPNPFLAATA